MASEVFSNELSKVNELFFMSRKTASDQKAPNGQTNKTIQSSPLPRDESSSDEEEEKDEESDNNDEKENSHQEKDEEVVPQVVDPAQTTDEQAGETSIETQEKQEEATAVVETITEVSTKEPLNIDIELQMKEEVVQTVFIEIPEAEENKEEVENLLHDSPTILDNESTAPSTQVATDEKSNNRYELLEHFLSFIDTEEELNPVLCGYFAKLFQVLVSSHAKEIFTYVYSHPIVLDNLVRHSYQKSISDVLIRLMNTQENLFQGSEEMILTYNDINTLRCSYVLKIIQKLAPESSYED